MTEVTYRPSIFWILADGAWPSCVVVPTWSSPPPDQPTLRSLIDDYGLDRDLEDTAVILLLGAELGHSVSPAMMNRTFRAEGLDALYVPWALPDPAPVLASLAELSCIGAAVTIPLKERVADTYYDPLRWLWDRIRGRSSVDEPVEVSDEARALDEGDRDDTSGSAD